MNDATNAPPAGARGGGRTNAWSNVWPWLFWALSGAWLAVSDLRSDDVQPAVLVLLAGGGVLGFARPRAWWAWGAALAAWIVAEPLVGAVLHVRPLSPYNAGALIAFVPALLGAGAGAAFRRIRPLNDGA